MLLELGANRHSVSILSELYSCIMLHSSIQEEIVLMKWASCQLGLSIHGGLNLWNKKSGGPRVALLIGGSFHHWCGVVQNRRIEFSIASKRNKNSQQKMTVLSVLPPHYLIFLGATHFSASSLVLFLCHLRPLSPYATGTRKKVKNWWSCFSWVAGQKGSLMHWWKRSIMKGKDIWFACLNRTFRCLMGMSTEMGG